MLAINPHHPFFSGFGHHRRWAEGDGPFDFGFGKFGRRFVRASAPTAPSAAVT